MKYLLILLFSITAFAQSDSISRSNISVVSAEKLNVVYRGIDNPIKIAVPGAKSFTASAPGLKKGTGEGNYILNPGLGNDVTVTIVGKMTDGKLLTEKKVFRIKGLPAPAGIINNIFPNDDQPIRMTKDELIKSVIGIEMKDFLFNVNFKVTGFTLSLPNKHTNTIVEGNLRDDKAIKIIKGLKPKALVIIMNIRFGSPEACQKAGSNILIEIIR